jgi:hypothetical protein
MQEYGGSLVAKHADGWHGAHRGCKAASRFLGCMCCNIAIAARQLLPAHMPLLMLECC